MPSTHYCTQSQRCLPAGGTMQDCSHSINKALVSCLGHEPCFSKITYMVTVCKYCKGLHSVVDYCAFLTFLLWPTWAQFQLVRSFFIWETNARKICILLETWQIAMKICETHLLNIYYFSISSKNLINVSKLFNNRNNIHTWNLQLALPPLPGQSNPNLPASTHSIHRLLRWLAYGTNVVELDGNISKPAANE